MSKFKVGDRVKCIDNMGTDLAKGSEYLVAEVMPGNCIRVEGRSSSWVAERFELVKEETPLPPTFGELWMDKQALMFIKWRKGAVIQQFVMSCEWVDDPCPTWLSDLIFRIKPEEAIPDSFDWSHATFNYVARDENGEVYGYMKAPEIRAFQWIGRIGDYYSVTPFASYKKGNLPWDQSLICRPGFEVK